MGQEIVTVLVDGKQWTAFRRVMVRASFRDAARSFHIDIAAEPGPVVTARVFRAGAEIDILANGDLLCRGYVDRYKPRLTEHSQAEIAVAGRSRSQDFIDSSAVHPTGNFKNKTLVEIARAIHDGSVIDSDQVLEKIKAYQLTPGEGAFSVIEKLARSQGLWPVGQADGSILLTVAGKGRNGPLIEGVNCLSLEADHNWSGRHSKVIVRAQQPWGHGPNALEIEAEARDAEVKRNRPVIIIQDDDSDKDRAGKRARHRRDSEAGNSLKANAKVQGFRDDAGALWEPGNLSFTDSPFLDVSQDMAIEALTWSQERGKGTDTALSLTDPHALGGKAKARKGGKAGKSWGNDAGEE